MKIKPHVSTPADIFDRKEYVERIHACYLGQGMGLATHDVLIYHDAALRARARTPAEERLIKAALAPGGTLLWQHLRRVHPGLPVFVAARAVQRERERGKK